MNKVKMLTLATIGSLSMAATSFTVNAASMPTYVEDALVNVCKAVKSNKLYRYNNTMKSYRLQDKTVALKVMCNGNDIISFAELHNADKTAAKLQRSLGGVSIIDVAKAEKINVTFEEGE